MARPNASPVAARPGTPRLSWVHSWLWAAAKRSDRQIRPPAVPKVRRTLGGLGTTDRARGLAADVG